MLEPKTSTLSWRKIHPPPFRHCPWNRPHLVTQSKPIWCSVWRQPWSPGRWQPMTSLLMPHGALHMTPQPSLLMAQHPIVAKQIRRSIATRLSDQNFKRDPNQHVPPLKHHWLLSHLHCLQITSNHIGWEAPYLWRPHFAKSTDAALKNENGSFQTTESCLWVSVTTYKSIIILSIWISLLIEYGLQRPSIGACFDVFQNGYRRFLCLAIKKEKFVIQKAIVIKPLMFCLMDKKTLRT